MASAVLVLLALRTESLERVLADRLEQPEARYLWRPAAANEAAVDERGETGRRLAAEHRLRILERPAAREYCELRQQGLFRLRQERVAPVERRAQRLLAKRQIARALDEQLQRLLEALLDRGGLEHLGPRGRELYRKR